MGALGLVNVAQSALHVVSIGHIRRQCLWWVFGGPGRTYFVRHPELSPAWRLFAVTGFLGGLTTFSTYSAEVVALIEQNELMWALAVAAAHLLVSLALTAVGIWIYRAVAG